mmetsp:Transcript_4541/g.17861  ORF Transcript_4541/g.17861 Transcript_4541/m.17861 type:complete len:230 (-) Transcript_4541:2621-3310(-)
MTMRDLRPRSSPLPLRQFLMRLQYSSMGTMAQQRHICDVRDEVWVAVSHRLVPFIVRKRRGLDRRLWLSKSSDHEFQLLRVQRMPSKGLRKGIPHGRRHCVLRNWRRQQQPMAQSEQEAVYLTEPLQHSRLRQCPVHNSAQVLLKVVGILCSQAPLLFHLSLLYYAALVLLSLPLFFAADLRVPRLSIRRHRRRPSTCWTPPFGGRPPRARVGRAVVASVDGGQSRCDG